MGIRIRTYVIGIAVALALVACGKGGAGSADKPAGSPELPRMIEMRKAMCACKDMACANDVAARYRDLREALDKYPADKRPQDLAVEVQAMVKCMAAAASPQPTP